MITSISLFLSILIKFFFIIFIIGFIGTFISIVKNEIFTPADFAAFKDTFTFNKSNEENK